jgi:hypothetical protein
MSTAPHIVWQASQSWNQPSASAQHGGPNSMVAIDALTELPSSQAGQRNFHGSPIIGALNQLAFDQPSTVSFPSFQEQSLLYPDSSNDPIFSGLFGNGGIGLAGSSRAVVHSTNSYEGNPETIPNVTKERASILAPPLRTIKHSPKRHLRRNGVTSLGYANSRKSPLHKLVEDKAIRKTKATSGRLRLIEALGLLEPLKDTLKPYNRFSHLISLLEESITDEMMCDTRNTRIKAASGYAVDNFTHQSVAHVCPIYETDSSTQSLDLSFQGQSSSSITSVASDQSANESDLMDLVMDIETPRATTAMSAAPATGFTYRCVFQKDNQKCDLSFKRK